MSLIPGWDSITGAATWSNGWFWVSIGALILLGVSEVVSHRYSERKDELATQAQTALQEQHDQQIAQLNLQTANANARAAQANERAAKAELDLAKFRAPRSLTAEQRQRIIDRIKSFAGQKYALSVAAGSEASDFLCVLDSVLTAAGWRKHEPFGFLKTDTDCGPADVNILSDVHIRVAVGASSETGASADALGNALLEANIQVKGGRDPTNIPDKTVVMVMVGIKSS